MIDLPDKWDGFEVKRQEALTRAWISPRGMGTRPEDVPAYLVGANFSTGRPLIDHLALFDVRLGAGSRFHAAEATDWIYRAFKSVSRICFEPSARVFHDHRRDAATLRRMFHRYNGGEGAVAVKHMLAGDWTRFRIKYRGLFSEVGASRAGRKPWRYPFLDALGTVQGGVVWACHAALFRLTSDPAAAAAAREGFSAARGDTVGLPKA
ncbi:MAG: hypothetical protein NZ523_10795 [Elioraea sp.]|nr:hypothetical protein [Elioraea sp.]